mmetsp:Transcript_23005/g.47774  ORF Transcript_23005/g.47774 Transcript_23005/m.47774 type:complete len:345 (+) Transcript_23005:164-1198(+)
MSPVPAKRQPLPETSQVHAVGDVALLLVECLLFGLPHVRMGNLHASLAQGQHARLCADRLDVGATEVILGDDKLLEVDIVSQRHSRGVDLEDAALCLLIWQRELDLTIDTPRTNHGRVKGVDAICGHDDLDFATVIETIQLIEQLQHGPLDLLLTAAGGVITLCGNGINLVNEDDGGSMLLRHTEHLAHELGTITEVLLDQLTANNTEECCGGLIRHSLGQQCLTSAWHTVQDDSLWRLDAHILVQLGMRQRQLHSLLDLLNLLLKTTNVGVILQRCLVHLHDTYQGVHLISQDTDDAEVLVVHQHGGARLQLILVHEGHDIHVVLGSHCGGDNAMVLIDELLE